MPRRLSLPLDKIPARSPGHVWLIAVVAGVVGFIGSLVTIAAAIGWVYAILVVALVAVALPNWLKWVRRRGLQRELLSAKSEIASLSHQPRNGMVADYQFVLSRIATSSSRPLIESCKVQYRIGENASGDRTTRYLARRPPVTRLSQFAGPSSVLGRMALAPLNSPRSLISSTWRRMSCGLTARNLHGCCSWILASIDNTCWASCGLAQKSLMFRDDGSGRLPGPECGHRFVSATPTGASTTPAP